MKNNGDGGNGGGLKKIVQSDSEVGGLKIVKGCGVRFQYALKAQQ